MANFFDLHSDVLTGAKNPLEILDNLGNNVKVCAVIYNGDLSKTDFNNLLKTYNKTTNKNAYLCFENVGYNFLKIDDIIALNPLYVQLTYNGENKYGYGCDFNKKLKPLGVNAVKKLSSNGIYVDVAHLSEKGALDVINYSDKVICSHALFKDVYNHKRNLSKSVIKGIISKNGLIGACLVNYFISSESGDNNLTKFFKHIDYFLQNFGDDSLAIGTDFFGSDSFVNDIDGYNKISNLKNAFLNNGYSLKTVDKIFYKNAL
ncbi:MAG: membrane dipeptidase, partial [Clostridia bacterium]|nr:membrane dipeptidase [Clostridia bacterium]